MGLENKTASYEKKAELARPNPESLKQDQRIRSLSDLTRSEIGVVSHEEKFKLERQQIGLQSKMSPEQQRHDFERNFDPVASELLKATSERIGIFGSLAAFRRRKSQEVSLPGDIDIATTPQGAIDLYKACQERTDIIITEHIGIHDRSGPLKAIRFGGFIVKNGLSHPFEVFGEGGSFNGERFRGLFRLGDEEFGSQVIIEDELIGEGYLQESYEQLKGIEGEEKAAEKHRDTKIRKLKRQRRRAMRFDPSKLDQSLDADQD